jgi:diacylglycerol kinase family enzyme
MGQAPLSSTGTPAPRGATVSQRWLARLALAAAAAAVLVPPGAAGTRSLWLVGVGLAGLTLTAAAAWWALSHRGVLRLLGAAVAATSPVAVLALYSAAHLTWVVLLSLGLWAVAVTSGHAALSRDGVPQPIPELEAPAPRQPFMIMNPRSGGGKVARLGLVRRAEALGVKVALLRDHETVDAAELARKAVADGADLLGVAGGDGTQALVAGVAAEHGIPLLVIPAGTRNHFALDLGLDRDDPVRCLEALGDGVELRVDLGVIGGRPFVNNASFGAYAAVVQSPAYRAGKVHTTLDLLPELLTRHRGARLRAHAGGVVVVGPQALLVSNNPYGTGDLAGLGRRARLDSGLLGVLGVTVDSAAQAAGLLRGQHAHGLTRTAAREVVVEADQHHIPVGVDGEALSFRTPVRCAVLPGALRVRVPRDRPGVPAPKPPMNWTRLRQLALATPRAARTARAA